MIVINWCFKQPWSYKGYSNTHVADKWQTNNEFGISGLDLNTISNEVNWGDQTAFPQYDHHPRNRRVFMIFISFGNAFHSFSNHENPMYIDIDGNAKSICQEVGMG